MVCLLRPPSRDQGNRTRERQQKTLVGLRESFLPAAPGLKAHLEAEPSARPVPLPGHCRLPPRLVLPAQVEMMASTQQHSLVRLVGAALHTTESARKPMLLEQHCPPRDWPVALGDDRGRARGGRFTPGGVSRREAIKLRRPTTLERRPPMTIRGGGNPTRNMALQPWFRLGPPPGAPLPMRMSASWVRISAIRRIQGCRAVARA